MEPADAMAALPDLELARSVAIEAAEAAGLLLRTRMVDGFHTRVKDPTGDVVTDLDRAAEEMIIGRIRAVFPAHRIIAEESGLLNPVAEGSAPVAGWHSPHTSPRRTARCSPGPRGTAWPATTPPRRR